MRIPIQKGKQSFPTNGQMQVERVRSRQIPGKKIGGKYYLINSLRCSPAWMSLYKSMGLGFPLLIWDSLLTNSHEKRKAVLTGRPFWAILKPSGVTGNGCSLNWLSCHNDNSNRLVAAGRLLLIVIVMMLLLMQIDAEHNTEYRISARRKPPQGHSNSAAASFLSLC